MTTSAREQLAALLKNAHSRGSFTTRRTAPPRDLLIEVRDIGTISLPVTAAQAKQLRLVARPAKYGKGEQTLLDRRVRDTWEVPRSRITIDRHRWHQTLVPMLDSIRDDLGLPETSSLKADLHSMLVYEPGQFFAPHQDSEKHDDMVGSLVVMLPSRSTGGELVVEQRGSSVRHKGSASALTFIAFYADTRHEVLPVERGYRVVLTYNLRLTGSTETAPTSEPVVDKATHLLRRHFDEIPAPRWRNDSSARRPADRLVFLLDHGYTERGLDWARLKGVDGTRAGVLRAAAAEADCQAVLAHADIHETWNSLGYEPRGGWGRRGRWYDDDFADGLADGEPSLEDLIEDNITIEPATDEPALDPHVAESEVTTSTPSVELTPVDSEYTGYMGNYGNTVDRWYRRAAIVLWPTERALAVKVCADPRGALREVLSDFATGADIRSQVETLLPYWADVVRRARIAGVAPLALVLASELDDPNHAAGLLDPFAIEALGVDDAPTLVTLADRHGESWFDDRVAAWGGSRAAGGPGDASRQEWVASLPALLSAVAAATGPEHARAAVANSLLDLVHRWWTAGVRARAAMTPPSRRQAGLVEFAPATTDYLRAAESRDRSDPVLSVLRSAELALLPLALAIIERHLTDGAVADDHGGEGTAWPTALARHCEQVLSAELAEPARAPDNWSISDPAPHEGCDDCVVFAEFLADRHRREMVWPLAKPRRQHIHHRIDQAELPVTHVTRREGSPHKLVLTKTADLFGEEADRRRRAADALAKVQAMLT